VSFPAGTEEFASVCPFLGLADDADSHATYATDAHRCYNLQNPTRIATNHQETYCLGANHVTCPVFQGQGIAAAGKGAPAAPAAAAAAGAAATGAAAASRSPFQRTPPATQDAPAGRPAGRTDRPLRSPGALSPRPRAGGISLPVATIGLFALAAIVIGLAFWIQSIVGDDDNGSLSPADTLATNQANASRTAQGGGNRTTTPTAGSPTTPANGSRTPGASATTPAGGGQVYTIKSGDSCYGIAEQFDIDIDDFLAANNFTLENQCQDLQPGQNVRIP